MRWIFARRLEGCSTKSIARGLNDRGVPCPSAYDRDRNRHRNSTGWGCTTVAAILANPRYTGRQVWNRQPTQHHDDPRDVAGREPGRRRSSRRDWVISDRIAHEALVTEADFIAVQAVTALARPADGIVRSYQLVGVLRCAVCDRRMISHWAHDRAWYRCRHGYPNTPPGAPARPGSLYLREDRLLVQIKAAMPASWGSETPESAAVAEYLRLHRLIAVCDATTVVLEPE